MKNYNTLQSRPSEPCLPVHSDLANAQAVHTSISPLPCDTSQAEPRTLQTRSTEQENNSLALPFMPILWRRQAPLDFYQDQITL